MNEKRDLATHRFIPLLLQYLQALKDRNFQILHGRIFSGLTPELPIPQCPENTAPYVASRCGVAGAVVTEVAVEALQRAYMRCARTIITFRK